MKKELKFPIGEEKSFNARCPWNIGDETDINEVISFFVSAKEKGATHVEWYAESDDGSSESCNATPVLKRFETDEEYNNRVQKERDRNALQRQHDEALEFLRHQKLKQMFKLK